MKKELLSVLLIIYGCVVGIVRSVVYDVETTPSNVKLGQTLLITIKLSDFTSPVGDVRLVRQTETGQAETTVFEANNGCRFVLDVYISTGSIQICDTANQIYKISFSDVTADHIGLYWVEAYNQRPGRSKDTKVGFLMGVEDVKIHPDTSSVIAGEKFRFVCSVKPTATLPVTFKWNRITILGDRVDPPAHVTHLTNPDDRFSSVLEWDSVRKDDNGPYECRAKNQAGSERSEPVFLNVFYGADSVALSVSRTDVNAGDNVTFTCSSTGGNPRPGLVLYRVDSGTVLDKRVQSSDRSLSFTKTVDKSDNEAQFACKTEVELSTLTVPVKVSTSVKLSVNFPPDEVDIETANTPIMVKQEKLMKCRGGESRPSGFISWKKQFNDRVVGLEASSSIKRQGEHGGFVLESSVTVNGKIEDNGAIIWCQVAYSYANGTTVIIKSASKTLSVLPVNTANISPSVIALAVSLVVVVLAVAIIAAVYCCYRKWKKQKTERDIQNNKSVDGDPSENLQLMEMQNGPQVPQGPRSVTYNCYNIYVQNKDEAHGFLSLDGRSPERRAIEIIPGHVKTPSLQRALSVPSHSSRGDINMI